MYSAETSLAAHSQIPIQRFKGKLNGNIDDYCREMVFTVLPLFKTLVR